jgi:hypothetical protein
MTLEITGEPPHVDAVISRLEPLGIVEMVRTGQVAMRRGDTALSAAQYFASARAFARAPPVCGSTARTFKEISWRRCSTTRMPTSS